MPAIDDGLDYRCSTCYSLAVMMLKVNISLYHQVIQPLVLLLSMRGKDGWTVLHSAYRHADVTSLLLCEGCDPNVVDNDGNTPIMVASFSMVIVILLLHSLMLVLMSIKLVNFGKELTAAELGKSSYS